MFQKQSLFLANLNNRQACTSFQTPPCAAHEDERRVEMCRQGLQPELRHHQDLGAYIKSLTVRGT